jgi:hypothetical protein
MRTPRSPVAIAVALLAVLAAGCGASSTTPGAPASTAPPGNPLAALSARQILAKTIADFKAASSVHIAGSERAAGQSFAMDLPALEGKYVRLSPKGPATSSFGAFCSLSQLAGQVSGAENQLVKGQTTTIGGQPALQLKDTRQTGSAYVTISASPEFLQTGDTGGHVDFTDYNAPLALTAPPASQTVAGSAYGL